MVLDSLLAFLKANRSTLQWIIVGIGTVAILWWRISRFLAEADDELRREAQRREAPRPEAPLREAQREKARNAPPRISVTRTVAKSKKRSSTVEQHRIGSILWSIPKRMRVGRTDRLEVRVGD
jgi:hypothetical protein